jgi:hypothetical protein
VFLAIKILKFIKKSRTFLFKLIFFFAYLTHNVKEQSQSGVRISTTQAPRARAAYTGLVLTHELVLDAERDTRADRSANFEFTRGLDVQDAIKSHAEIILTVLQDKIGLFEKLLYI